MIRRGKMPRTGRSTSVLALLVTIALAACAERSPVEENGEATQAIAVKAEAPRSGDIADVLTATGETAATSTVRLGSPIAGRVIALGIQAGDPVSRGQVLARVLSLENEAALSGFALLRGAGSSLNVGGGTGATALEREIATRTVAVRSPLAGLVIERLHNAGEQVTQGEALLELFDPSSLVAIAQAPVEAAPRVARGMSVEVAGPGFRATGRVEAVLPALSAGALTVPIRISFGERPPTRLLHSAVECRITLAEHHGALLIPGSALLAPTRGANGAVFVVEGGHARRRAIQVGLRTPHEIEVTGGLAAADRVIVGGGYALPEGTAVAIDEHAADEGSTTEPASPAAMPSP